MLVRTAGRYREAGVRLALCAGRARLFGQVLKEALVLVAMDGSLGLWLSDAGLRAFTGAAPIELPRLEEVQTDWRVLLFAFAATTFSTVACGLARAWRLSRIQPLDSLKAASSGHTEAGRKLRLREMLVSLEVALSAVLLTAAGLLLVSFLRLTHVERGFATARDQAIRLMMVRLRPPCAYLGLKKDTSCVMTCADPRGKRRRSHQPPADAR
jgi:putative ABC transport system permease protein